MKTVLLVMSMVLVPPVLFLSNTNIQEIDKKLIIKANDELLNKGNLDFADKVFADNYRLKGAEAGGPEQIKRAVRNVRRAFPDIQVEVKDIITEGNVAAWRRIHTGTHEGEIAGIAATGKKIEWQTIIYSRFENGKIVEEWGVGNLQLKLREASE